ncbi:hypothetical protein GJ496_003250 [Pomphorhynchus laevis]|nr:hypothetical protein GJ496_003250 [Pomphorhynchus laevis]
MIKPSCHCEMSIPSQYFPLINSLEYDVNNVFKSIMEFTFSDENPVNRKLTPKNCNIKFIGDDHDSTSAAKAYVQAIINAESYCEIKINSAEVFKLLSQHEADIKRKHTVHFILRQGCLLIILGNTSDVKAAFNALVSICGSSDMKSIKAAFHNNIENPKNLLKLLFENVDSALDCKDLIKSAKASLVSLRQHRKMNVFDSSESDSDSNKESLPDIDCISITSDDLKVEANASKYSALILKLEALCCHPSTNNISEDIQVLKMKLLGHTLKPIVIDGLNITHDEKVANGVNIERLLTAVLFFLRIGCEDIKVVHPCWMHLYDHKGILQTLKEWDLLAYSPSISNSSHDDDLYILTLALRKRGCVISNDKFRQYFEISSGVYKSLIEHCVIPYMLVDAIFIPADPPHGRNGQQLWQCLTTH